MPFAFVGAAAAAVSAGVGVVGALDKGSAQSSAVSAGQAQADAALAPYSATGTAANTATANLLGLNGTAAQTASTQNWQNTPGYQFALTQGEEATNNNMAGQGMARSGADEKAIDTFSTGLADSTYNQYVSNLNSLSNYGITAAGGQASAATSAAGSQSAIAGNAIGGVTSSLSGLAGNTTAQNGLSSLFSNNVSPSTVASNASYQAGAFAANPGAEGPFQ